MFYSASVGGFFDPAINPAIPEDAVELTRVEYEALIEGHSNGKLIVADSKGNPGLIDPPPPTTEELTEIARGKRAQAYKQEADPIFFKSQRGEATQEEWLAKVEEIKARYPDPVS